MYPMEYTLEANVTTAVVTRKNTLNESIYTHPHKRMGAHPPAKKTFSKITLAAQTPAYPDALITPRGFAFLTKNGTTVKKTGIRIIRVTGIAIL
jgi:hypothetical protein